MSFTVTLVIAAQGDFIPVNPPAYELADRLISLSPIKRKTEDEGRQPLLLYFDNMRLELPLKHSYGLFSPATLASYPRYEVRVAQDGQRLFRGVVDIQSVTYTRAQTVTFEVMSVLGLLERVRLPDPWQRFDILSGAWDGYTGVQLGPLNRVGSSDFWESILLQPYGGWGASMPWPPVEVGDFIIHPDHPAFTYQVRARSWYTTDSTTWVKIELDRPWFDPEHVSGAAYPTYWAGEVMCKADSFYGQPFIGYTGGGQVEHVLGDVILKKILRKAGWEGLTVIDAIGDVEPEVAAVLAHTDEPLEVLFKLLHRGGRYLYINRLGVVTSAKWAGLNLPQPLANLALIAPARELDYQLDFAWDKRLDEVEVTGQWYGSEETEYVARRSLNERGYASDNKLRVTIVADEATTDLRAGQLYNLFAPRRMVRRTQLRLGDALPGRNSGSYEVRGLDLFHKVEAPGYGEHEQEYWISEIEIDLLAQTMKLSLITVQGWLPEGVDQF